MNREQLMGMDPNILLSLVNMKLRDEFENLHDLCYELDVEDELIVSKLSQIGYKYVEAVNQFKGFED